MHGMTYESPPPLGPNCAPVSAVQPAATDAAVLAGWKEIILVHVGSVVVGHHPYLRFGSVWFCMFVCLCISKTRFVCLFVLVKTKVR